MRVGTTICDSWMPPCARPKAFRTGMEGFPNVAIWMRGAVGGESAVLYPLHQLIVSGSQYIGGRNAGSDGVDTTPRWRRRIQIGGFGRNAVIAQLERLAAVAQVLVDVRRSCHFPCPELGRVVLANVGLVESCDVEFG